MNLDGAIWLILPLITTIIILIAKIKGSKKTNKVGIIFGVIIISVYIMWRLLNGGFEITSFP
jgi:hypothetical protein